MKGNVFDIQRYSIHDGKGIRTVVFMKGCPLRCKWCANPESWLLESQLFYKASTCIHCNLCNNFTDATKCPSEALCIKGKWMTVEEVMHEIRKDIPFYKRSNGGVTISGGEPLLQYEFTLELLKQCKEEGISTAIETTGFVDQAILTKVLPYVDLFLYDIKSMDSDIHKRWTGVDNHKILENLKYLANQADIMVRTPMIPEVNDKKEDIEAIMNFLKECNISKYALLPFHQYGSSKYEGLHLEYEMKHVKMHNEEYANAMKQYVKENGFSDEF